MSGKWKGHEVQVRMLSCGVGRGDILFICRGKNGFVIQKRNLVETRDLHSS